MNEEELKLVIANNIQKGWVSYGDFRTDVAVEAISEALTEQLRIGGVSQQRELLIGYIINEQRLYCGKPDRKLSEDLADDYIANL